MAQFRDNMIEIDGLTSQMADEDFNNSNRVQTFTIILALGIALALSLIHI